MQLMVGRLLGVGQALAEDEADALGAAICHVYVGRFNTMVARATSWVFDGADLNVEALTRCSGGLDRVLYYDVLEQRAEFRDRYDVAILFDVIEHIEPTRPFLESVLFHLKPGGILLINVPALQTLFSVYDKVAGHYRRYDRPMMTAEFEGLPATVVAISVISITLLGRRLQALLARGDAS